MLTPTNFYPVAQKCQHTISKHSGCDILGEKMGQVDFAFPLNGPQSLSWWKNLSVIVVLVALTPTEIAIQVLFDSVLFYTLKP